MRNVFHLPRGVKPIDLEGRLADGGSTYMNYGGHLCYLFTRVCSVTRSVCGSFEE